MAMSVGDEQARRADSGAVTIGAVRYVRAPEALRFPEFETVPETKRHLELRTLLYQLLHFSFADSAHIGCDQFVYWDAANPRVCLAPDAFVRLGGPDDLFGSWKVWENGAPHVAVEIISDHDARDKNWDAKLGAYRQLGIRELVRFDPEASEPLRIWDRIEGDLLERAPSEGAVASAVLPGFWVVATDKRLGPVLRLSRDDAGRSLFLTPAEAEAEARKAEAEARKAEAEAAATRIRELEAELERRQE